MAEQKTDVRPFRDRITLGSMSWREFARALEEVPEQVAEHFRIVSAGGHTLRPELKLVPERDTTPAAPTQTSGPPRDWQPTTYAPHPRTYAESHYGEHEETNP